MNKIYQELEILTITYKSDHIIEKCLSNIDENFKITVVENSSNQYFKEKNRKKKKYKLYINKFKFRFWNCF